MPRERHFEVLTTSVAREHITSGGTCIDCSSGLIRSVDFSDDARTPRAQDSNILRLDLRRNFISVFPPTLAPFSQIVELWLSGNELRSFPPLYCPTLRSLHLGSNHIENVLPLDCMQGLCSLRELDLRGNRIGVLHLAALACIAPSLERLSMAANCLHTIVDELRCPLFSSLFELSLLGHSLSSASLNRWLARCPRLEVLITGPPSTPRGKHAVEFDYKQHQWPSLSASATADALWIIRDGADDTSLVLPPTLRWHNWSLVR